jgi:acyl carrier protein
MPSIEESVRAFIAKEILFADKYAYPDTASFLDEGIVDSMNVLQIVMFIEKQFGIKVEDEEVVPDNFDSIARLAAYVQTKQPAKSPAERPAPQPAMTSPRPTLATGK